MSTSCYLCLSKPLSKQSPRSKINSPQVSIKIIVLYIQKIDPYTKLNGQRFPNDATIRKAWFKAVGLSEEVDDISHTRICCLHFKIADFVEPNVKLHGGRMSLKRDAVPTVSIPNSPPAVVNEFSEPSSTCIMEDIHLVTTPVAAITKAEMATRESVVEMRTVCNNGKQESKNYYKVVSAGIYL